MKRVYIGFLLTTLMMVACTNEMELPVQNNQNVPIVETPFYRDYDEALSIALGSVQSGETRGIGERRVKEHYLYQVKPTTRNSNDTIDVLFHVINFDKDEGFALISADRRTTDVYAYSDKGNLNMEDAIQNTGVGIFMEDAASFYREEIIRRDSIESSLRFDPILIDSLDEWELLPTELYNGMICYVKTDTLFYEYNLSTQTHWGQTYPYNYYCPTDQANNGAHYPAGCGTIAAAQIMAYYREPEFFGEHTYNWDSIRHSNSYVSYNIYSDEAAKFIYDVAVDANAIFGEMTSTTLPNLRLTLQHFGYQTSSISLFIDQNIANSIHFGRLVLATGMTPPTRNLNSVGHAWVIDGWKGKDRVKKYYSTRRPFEYQGSNKYSIYRYYYCNWGAGGSYDGYFLASFFVAGSSYSFNKQIVYDICPNDL